MELKNCVVQLDNLTMSPATPFFKSFYTGKISLSCFSARRSELVYPKLLSSTFNYIDELKAFRLMLVLTFLDGGNGPKLGEYVHIS